MAVKRRDKLTPAEALERAKNEAFPYWQGSDPLMVGVREGEGAKIYPLDSRLAEKPWLILFVDPTRLSIRDIGQFARMLAHRYGMLKLGFMVVLKLPFSFCSDVDWARKQASHFFGGWVSVMDVGGLLAAAFRASELPKMILLQQGQIAFERSGSDWRASTELELQKFLRKSDPGLACFPAEVFPENPSRDLPDPSEDEAPRFSGNWTKEADAWVTSDPAATLSVEAPGSKVGIVARGTGECWVELVSDLPREPILEDDLKVTDPTAKRRVSLSLGEPRLYCLFKGLPQTHRKLKFSFPSAAQGPVSIYSLRFAD